MGLGSGTETSELAAEFTSSLRLAIRHPNGSDAGSEEEKMSTVQSVHLTLKAVRLLEFCEAEGFEKADDLLLASLDYSVCPAICMECGCTMLGCAARSSLETSRTALFSV
jgi:hypothetical protein